MAEYDNTNRGVLFKNDKEGNDKRPDYTGKINFGGKDYRLSAWIKEGKAAKFMSLSVDDKPIAANGEVRRPEKDESVDQDIPFN